MKKLVFTVTTDLNFDQRMQRICHSLYSAGYDVALIGRSLPSSRPLEQRQYQQHRINCLFYKGKFFYLEYNLRLFFHLLFSKTDLICGIDLDTAIPAMWTAKLKGVPFIYDAHEYFPEIPEVQSRGTVKRIWEKVEDHVVRNADAIYTVSKGIAEIFQRKYGVEVGLIRNLPIRKPTSASQRQNSYMVYAGAVNEGRGIKELLYAMKSIDGELQICGEGDLLEEMKELSIELDLGDRVIFHGNLRPAELSKVVAKASFGIMLLENIGLSYYHSLANKFFDYMQAGIPQVCIDFPEYRRINDECAVAMLVPLEVEEIVSACRRLRQDSLLYDRLAENAALASQTYTWENEEKRLIVLYKELLSQ